MCYIANNVMPLARDDYQFGDPVVRVPNRVIRDGLIKRRQPVMIYRKENRKAKVLRFALGVGRPPEGFDDETILLDYDAKIGLGLRRADEASLEVRPATRWEIWGWYWNHDQPPVRLSIRLGVLSVVLGVIGAMGVALSLVSLIG
ncbi:MAG: hypothetical protein RJQ08_10780 [Salinisphaeraceae bacterium]